MAFLHRAWQFEPDLAHRAIATAVVDGDRISIPRLSEQARATLLEGQEEFMRMLPFDPESLENEPDPAHLYMVALGQYLRPTTSIKHPGILLWVVQELGWTEAMAWRLIRGLPLSSLLSGLQDPLIDLVREKLGQFGGWLSRQRCEDLLREFRSMEGSFLDVGDSLLRSMNERIQMTEELARVTLQEMYESVVVLFEEAAQLPSSWAILCISP